MDIMTVEKEEDIVTVDAPRSVEEILEKLAELEHEQWAHIIKYLLEQGCITLARYQSFNYKQLANTPYSKLSESQKESDREWARKVWAIVEAQCVGRAQLKKLIEEFPNMDNLEFWTEPSRRLPIINGQKPDRAFHAVKYVATVLEWKKRLERLGK